MQAMSSRFFVFFISVFLAFCATTVQAQTSQTNVDQAKHLVDEKGVPQLAIDGVGNVAHPAWTALYALAYAGIENYDPSLAIKADPQRFTSTIAWLKNNLIQDKNGLWVWSYHFDSTYNDVSIKAPWSSAFAQATGIQALLAHWKNTGDKSSLEMARKAAESLFVPLDKGGLLFTAGDDVWFEEIPAPVTNPSHILNGHMRALLALAELQDATGDQEYQQWFSKGSETLLRWLPLYDAGYWLRYDLNPRKQELLFRLANPYGFANPELAIDRIVLRDPLSGKESVLDVGEGHDAEGPLRIAGNDWGQREQLDGRSVRRLRSVMGERESTGSEGKMVAPFSYFYIKLPNEWNDNLRRERFELSIDYFDDRAGNLELQLRSIAPESTSFRHIPDGEILLSGSGKWRSWKTPITSKYLGYWVGKTYGLKHADYLHQIAGRDKRFISWADLSRGYINSVSKVDFKTVVSKINQSPNQTPVLPWYSMDDDGVLLMHVQDVRTSSETGTAVYSPYIVASQAIDGPNMADLDNILRRFKIDKAQVKKKPALDWLLSPENQVDANGSKVYKFNFLNVYNDVVTASPWQSSFAQTFVMKALLKVVNDNGVDKGKIKSLLGDVLKAYAVDVASGGLLHVDKQGSWFFEEVPNRTHVLNAQLSALPVIDEVGNKFNFPLGSDLISQGLRSLRENLNKFDTGYWMRYDLNPKKELLFQLDWLKGESSPLIESMAFEAPQFAKRALLRVGSEQAFEGAARISGLDWLPTQQIDGKLVRGFANGYLTHKEAVQGGTRQNVYAALPLPETSFADYFDVQPHRLVIRYKDVAAGQFVIKVQSINEGNVLDFTPLRNAVITTAGDQQWKEAIVEVRPQDMGWYKGPDYQTYEVDQLDRIAKLTKDWFFEQYAERQRYFLEAKNKGRPVIIAPVFNVPFKSVALSLVESSATYKGFGFENALDSDPNDDYVASIENTPREFAILKMSEPARRGVLNITWESQGNYARKINIVARDAHGAIVKEFSKAGLPQDKNVEIKLDAPRAFDTLRLEFSDFVGQPRLLMRLLELKTATGDEKNIGIADASSNSRRSDSIFLSAEDPRNPLHVFRLPVTQQVKKLSDQLSVGAVSEHQKILKFMEFINGFKVGVARSGSPDDTINERKGACGTFTNTLLALAAGQGLEGRVLSLLNYPINDGHAVSEIKINGKWSLYDATYNAYYTYENSDVPLSHDELKTAYINNVNVVNKANSTRAGLESYTGRNIYLKAFPSGVIGADKPFVFPLAFDFTVKSSLQKNEFGPRWQGANFIGAASTNQQQDWVFNGLKIGSKYVFEIVAESIGGDTGNGGKSFKLEALVQGGQDNIYKSSHVFMPDSKDKMSWRLPFVATSNSHNISLRHNYRGPMYRYLNMKSYKIIEKVQ